MSEPENVEGLLPEDNKACHLNVLNKSSLQQLKLSYHNSNIVSQTILEDVWSSNRMLFNDKAVNQILATARGILQNVDTSNMKTWKSSISEYPDPETLLEKALPTCNSCLNTSLHKKLEKLNKNQCQCDLGLKETSKEIIQQSHNSSKPPLKRSLEGTENLFVNNLLDEDSSIKFSAKEKSLKTKFFNKVVSNETTTEKTPQQNKERQEQSQVRPKTHLETAVNDCQSTSTIIDLEEENKAHKSNVAKITFKTAKEQLLATNPAAKRSLGASRRAQAKFVSPMISAQDKQETAEPTITDDRLKHVDPKMVELIESEIIDKGTPIGWDDIAGLELAKSVIQEAVVWPLLRPDIFTGLRRPPKGILLFGPPGTGKTLIGKCVAAQCNATFFSISASSLTSKWIGDGEKMVRALFAVARCHQPAVIFIDEIDSLLTQRSDTEHEATRRIKTEFLVQFDGAATAEDDRLLIVGATNRPQELDEAARRRLVKRLYIPLPNVAARKQIITNLLRCENNDLSGADVERVAALTEGYSGADMKSLCSEAAMGPVRAVPLAQIATIHRDSVRPVNMQDFINALQRVRPSVSQDDLGQYVKWNQTFGQGF